LQGLYRFRRHISRLEEFMRVFTGASIMIVAATAVSAFLVRDFNYSRGIVSLTWMLAILFAWLSRLFLYGMLSNLWRQGLARDRAIIVGSGEMGLGVVQQLRRMPGLGYELVGFVTDNDPPGTWVEGLPVIGPISAVGSLVREHAVSDLIIAEPRLSRPEVLQIVEQCPIGRVSIRVVPDMFQLMTTSVTIGEVGGLPTVLVRDVALRGWNLVIKRAMDLVITSIILILVSPLLVFIALLVKVSSPGGPVFYVQERVGLDGVPFLMIKFRSMQSDAERETGPVWARASDPRATRLGSILRRLSLDELPQFINVLLGEMSLVGPRPERPYFVEQFREQVPRYLERHSEKAGITGWAQVNGLRGNVSIEERTAYDLWYVENWTPWLDLKIMIKTLAAVVRGENAY
jgi:exopolysaccharide biosynthesis polyprenyl glycosylphosphotransferase